MSRNVNRINNWYNNQAAREDWEYIAAKATAAGRPDIVAANEPLGGDSWRQIDKAIGVIRAELGWPTIYQMRLADKINGH